MSVILMTVLAFAINDGSCWKATGSVHCKETSGPHQGTPVTHPNCWWNPDEGNVIQSCRPSLDGIPTIVCPSPYSEKYAEEPNVPTNLVPVENGNGHSLEGTEQIVCFTRTSCECLDEVEGYIYGICISGDTLYGSEPHQHYFYRAHPAGVGLACQVVGEGGGTGGGGSGGGGGTVGLEN